MAFDWIKIKTDYFTTPLETTLKQISEKWDVNETYLREVAAREKWVEEKNKIWEKADKRLTEILPETIAQVKARHARVGRNLQAVAIGALKDRGLQPVTYQEAVNGIVKGVSIERDAVGINDKDVKDEVYQKFSQFMFIFNLNGDELQRFVKSAFARGGLTAGSSSPGVSETPSEGSTTE